MKKSIIVGVSILSVFILCSLSYQPIIADTPIETISQVKKSKASDLDVDELKELYSRLIEMKSQSNDDCGCGDTTRWGFPVICTILFPIYFFLFLLWGPTHSTIILQIILVLEDIAEELGCFWE